MEHELIISVMYVFKCLISHPSTKFFLIYDCFVISIKPKSSGIKECDICHKTPKFIPMDNFISSLGISLLDDEHGLF